MNKNQGRKILLIVQLPPPVHGASIMNSNVFTSQIINRNFDIKCINLQFSRSIQEISKFSFRKILRTIYFAYKIVRKISGEKPDLVYFSLSPTGLAFYRDVIYILLVRLFKVKIVLHLHGKGIKDNVRNNLKRHLYQWIFKGAFVICLSRRLLDDIKDVYKSVPYIVPNGIKIQTDFELQKNRSCEHVPHILYLSNYVEHKGILVLIDALKKLADQGYLFRARLVGAPSDLTIEFLNNLVNNLGLSTCIEITGPRYGDDKRREFQNADIFVFPTFYQNETFGIVNLEAMQYSLPVISTTEGGIPDIIVESETGFLVEPENTEMLVDRIRILLENKELREYMGKKGYERFMNNYTLDHFENSMVRTFQDILSVN